MCRLRSFIERLKNQPRVFIQAHDFPDHDAVSSAFALSELLALEGIASHIIYNGSIDRSSIHTMIDTCNIQITHWQDSDIHKNDITITVDGCIGEKNMLDTPGIEIAVIDHHQVTPPSDLWYSDVRPEYGACASILVEYYQELGHDLPAPVATALHIGLNIDTAHLTRGYSASDIEAFATLHANSNTHIVNKICKNTLESKDLTGFKDLLDAATIHHRVAFAYLEQCPSKNILGILGDFMIAVEEIDAVIIAAHMHNKIHVSLRSEIAEFDVAALVRKVLNNDKLGFGGGHSHMAGGVIIHRDIIEAPSPAETVSTLFFDNIEPQFTARP